MPSSPRSFRSRLTAAVSSVALLAAGLVGAGLVGTAAPASAAEGVSLTDLEVERKAEPVGIDLDRPRFGWVIESGARGVEQESYRVRVATEAEGLDGDLVWDSGTVQDDRSFDVEYDGPALASTTGYVWDVAIETTAGTAVASSAFRTGFVDEADWDGAAWIGAPPPADPAEGWTDYTAEFDFSIQRHAFGAFFRANGPNNALMWQVSVVDGVAALRPHRKVNGGYSLLENKDISAQITAAQLSQGTHTLSVTVSPGAAADSTRVVTLIDDIPVDDRQVADTGNMRRGIVGFRASTNAGSNEQFTVHGVRVTRTSDDESLLATDFSDGNPFEGGTLVGDELRFTSSAEAFLKGPEKPAPLLRKEFSVSGPIANAT